MDLNGDGNKDLLTGCFEGGLYWMAGKGDGDFAAPEAVMDADDNVLRVGQYWGDEEKKWMKSEEDLGISGHAVDFDDDGDYDLLLGSNDGHLFVRINQGSATEPKYATENIQLMSGEGDDQQVLYTGDGHALPIVFDWDKDGLFDIITGSNNRGVLWARNIGVKGAPEFTELQTLVEPGQKDAEEVPVGIRLQVAAGDYDHDGINDLVVGDYNNVAAKDERTEEQIAKYDEAVSELSGQARKMAKLQRQLKEEEDEEAQKELQEQVDELTEARTELVKVLREFAPKRERHGFVWLFRGK